MHTVTMCAAPAECVHGVSQHCAAHAKISVFPIPLLANTLSLFMCSPDLTWRDVHYLIAYTSSHERFIGGSRTINKGDLVSHEFGFGAMNAEGMVSCARYWITVPLQQSSSIFPVPNNGHACL